MLHVSIPLENTIEFIDVTEISPLISKVKIKVCYLGENRNHTFLNKEVATELGKKLPGSPIVGYFKEEDKDYEEHSRDIVINERDFAIVDITKPYGFVDLNAKVWFEKFLDDGQFEREYLCTEGYIWTGVYPESQRITEIGNNQSMELKNVQGHWTNNFNSTDRFFIINDAIIEKLCILGENYEPCFEGAQIKTEFSLESQFNELKNAMFSLMQKLNETLDEGGSQTFMAEVIIDTPAVEEETPVVVEEETPVVEETPAVVEETPVVEEETPAVVEEAPVVEEPVETPVVEEVPAIEEPASPAYTLEEIPEYVSLRAEFEALQTSYAALETERNNLIAEMEPLRTFKAEQDRASKQAMINSFYMLSAEDKQDVVDNMDNYSLDEIEAKLSVKCFRNKVNFSLASEEEEVPATSFSLNGMSAVADDSNVPEWVKAVRQTEQDMK